MPLTNLFFANAAALWVAANQWYFIILTLVIIPFSLPAAIALNAWVLSLSVFTFLSFIKSRWMRFKNITIRSSSTVITNYLAHRQGLGLVLQGRVLEIHTWTYCSYRKKGGIEQYLKDLREDAIRFATLVKEGRLSCNAITCNSFNRYLLEALENAFEGNEITSFKGVSLVNSCLKLYGRKAYEKIQRRMFGKVYSHRPVSEASEWDLLIIKLKGDEVISCD